MTTHDLEKATDAFRDRVLEALDEAAKVVFGKDMGADDADLPELFSAIDRQITRLSVRYQHQLCDGYVGTPKWRAEREFLKGIGFEPRADLDS